MGIVGHTVTGHSFSTCDYNTQRERERNKSLSIDVVPHQLKNTDYRSNPGNSKALSKVQYKILKVMIFQLLLGKTK